MIGVQTRARARATTRPVAVTRRRFNPGAVGLNTLTYVIAFVFFFPVLWMVITGFKTEGTAVSIPPQFIFHPTLENYRAALFDSNYFSSFFNSIVLSLGSTALAFLLGIPAAYSLGLYPTKRTPGVLSWVLSTKMLPLVGIVVPLIVIYKTVLHLFDTQPGMILLYAAMNLPLVIWMMRSFFAEVPRELMEASNLDGAGFLRTMVSIILPLATPGLAATGLLAVIFTWNEFFLAVNMTGPNAAPLSVYISSFMTSEGLFWAKMSAAATVAVLPVFILGWTAQRSLVRGLTLGAVK